MTDAPTGRWADLLPRVLSALALVLVGGVELWLGGRYFHIFAGLMVAFMMWELLHMLEPARRQFAVLGAGFAGVFVAAAPEVITSLGSLTLIAASLIVGAIIGLLSSDKRRLAVPYGALIVAGGLTLIFVRDALGLNWIIWLVVVVVASDVAGYFAGKSLGGPKFWPAISPKKTWSGTIAGWIAAALVGVVFGIGSDMMATLVLLSLILAFAAQMGDIAESAIKRRTGVKDSSRLIPGHGGFLDRFDGLLGAAAALLVIAVIAGVPEGLL